jgi:gluconolactonase
MTRTLPLVLVASTLLLPGSASAQTAEIAAAMTIGLEGPASDRAGNLYFTDGSNDRILKLAPDGEVSTHKQPANRPNGLVIDSQDRLVAAERGSPEKNLPGRITRTDLKTGKMEVLAEKYQGKSFGVPNDVTYDTKGRLYFSAGGNIYRLDPDGNVAQLAAAPQVDSSNGVMVSLDDKQFYLGEQNRGIQGPRRVRVFDLSPEGTISNPRVLIDFFPGRGPDGMALDVEGNVYVVAGMSKVRGTSETLHANAGVYVFSPKGTQINFLQVPSDYVTNVAFGGKDMKTIFVTSGSMLYKFPSKIAGTHR